MKTLFRRLLRIGALLTLALAIPTTAHDDAYFPAAEWRTSTPEAQGMDSVKLLEALQYIEDEDLPIDSLTVIRNGYVVLDAYYYPYTADTPHQMWSATKSITATLVGIAIDRGLINSVDQTIISLYPQFADSDVNRAAETATIADFLAMSSGISCASTFRNEIAALESGDVTGHLADLLFGVDRRTYAPYRELQYCDLNSCLLLGAIQNALDVPVAEFAREALFEPLEITDYEWWSDECGMPLGPFGLHLTARDMARIGYLYLQGGRWAGTQVVSRAWVDFARCAEPDRCPFPVDEDAASYGYHWWIFAPRFYAAVGLGGQFIAVAPDLDIVVVITSYGSSAEQVYNTIPYGLIESRILGAASDTRIPPNPAAAFMLNEVVERTASPLPTQPLPLPDIAFVVNRQVFHLLQPIHTSFWPAEQTVGLERPCSLVSYELVFEDLAEATVVLYYESGEQLTLAIGLDDVWRVTPTESGNWAARGLWNASQEEFYLSTILVGGAERHDFVFRFADNRPILRWVQPEAAHMGATDVMRSVARQP